MGRAFADQVGQIRLTRLLHCFAHCGRRTRRTQIGAGAESPAPAGQHDHPDGGVMFGAIDGGVKPRGDVGPPGVEALWAVEREDRDSTVRGLVQHRVFGVGSTVAAGHLPRHLLMLDYRIRWALYPYCIPIGTAFHNCCRACAKPWPNSEFRVSEAQLWPCLMALGI